MSDLDLRVRARVGAPAPDFTMASTKNLATLDEPVRLSEYRGRFLVMLFYPLDFTFVCPTELRGFSDRHAELEAVGASVLGISVDSVHTHRAWIKASKDAGGLGELRFPLASDLDHAVSRAYGVLDEAKGHTLRGTFLVDEEGILRSALINDLDVGRSVTETIRTIQAFKTGGLCPVDWQPGQKTLSMP